MASILFCTPCYGGMVHAAHFRSCLNLKEELTKAGVAHDWLIGVNESLITRARNEMTASFLATDHSHMMWLDSDIEFEPQDVARLWNLSMGGYGDAPADIVCGVYAMKKRDAQWYAAWKDGQLVKDLDQFTSPIEVDYAGTGFLLIRREVIDTLVAIHGTYEGPNGRVPALYMTPIYGDIFESEDYNFCRKAREAGYNIIMDPTIRLRHWGQYAFGQ